MMKVRNLVKCQNDRILTSIMFALTRVDPETFEAEDAEDAAEKEEDSEKAKAVVGNAASGSSGDSKRNAEQQLVSEALKAMVAEENDDKEPEEDEEGADDGEPEDDFQAAWEAFELARSLYEKQKDTDDDVKLKLADTYIALGDVSLETGQQNSFSSFIPLTQIPLLLYFRKT